MFVGNKKFSLHAYKNADNIYVQIVRRGEGER